MSRPRIIDVQHGVLTALTRQHGTRPVFDLLEVGYEYSVPSDTEFPRTVPRFDLFLRVIARSAGPTRIRIRVQVPESDPTIPSLFGLYPGVEAPERETFDMFGIRFTGHPDLTRILMPEDWEGHPLRKDYSVGRVPVQFKEAPGPR